MYSFNFDFIFNAVYNALLGIRYAILFWVLRINPADYLEDHRFDPWDGLRDRGWIKLPDSAASGVVDSTSNTIYLGSTNADAHLSWWDVLKDKIFGIKPDPSTALLSGNSNQYGLNPSDVNYVADKVNNDPWFAHLHLSIQNPILSFFADIMSVATFFVLLLLIYVILRWAAIALEPAFKSKEKEKEKAKEEKPENKKEIKVESTKQAEDIAMPAGIPGLPIDESSLSDIEKEEIKEENNILLNYKPKNTLSKKENQHIKVSNSFTEESQEEKEKFVDIRRQRVVTDKEREKWYREKWEVVSSYMEGAEEALWRIGILEADNLLFEVLTDRGYGGLTLAEKLKQANFNTIDLAWSAHKVRNRIAHDGSRFVLTERMAKNTFELFRSILSEFKIFE